jgi:type II secretory pathway pseudopilin PulG
MVHTAQKLRGMTVVEVLVGVAIFALVVVFLAATLNLFFDNATHVREESKAAFLASEGIEMVRFVRDTNWNTIAALNNGTSYYLDIDPGTIALGATPEVVDGTYTRTVTFAAVYRDGSDDIVPSGTPGAVVDTGSRYVTVTLAWGSESYTLTALLTNIFDV